MQEQALPLSFAATGNRRNGGAFAVAGTASQLAVTGNRNSGAFHNTGTAKLCMDGKQGRWCLHKNRHCKSVCGYRNINRGACVGAGTAS